MISPSRGALYFVPILLFASMWMGAWFLISILSGWHELARFYGFSSEFDGEVWRWQSARTRWASHYNHCLTIGANREGLYLAMPFLFRAGHPALLIPWSDVSAVGGKSRWFPYTEFRFRQAPSVRLRLSERLSQRILAAAGGAWGGPATPAEPLVV